MGEVVEFPSNGTSGSGYLALPEGGTGPGVIVIQEWWGLVPHIKEVADRFAAAGFVALAPDLYHGASASEPDEAGKLMMALNLQKAGKDLSGAVDLVASKASGDGIGVVGFCMGGGLSLVLGTQRPDRVKAVSSFYGVIPWPNAQPDWSALAAATQLHIAEKDAFFSPAAAGELTAKLEGLGKDVTLHVYEGTDHAFFNDARPEVYDAAAASTAWDRTLALFRSAL